MQVMLLAAGRSTRLGSLGVALPKPLVPVCGYPVVAFGLGLCRAAGLTDVVVNLHHHGDAIRRVLGDGSSFGVSVRYSIEDELLGTGGGVARARSLFRSEPVLVMNAKVVADVDLRAVIFAHLAARPHRSATMVLREDAHPERYAQVGVAADGRVVSLPRPGGALAPPARSLMFTGIQVLDSQILDRLPGEGVSDLVADGYVPALRAGDRVESWVAHGYFAEHSTPESYLEGNLALLREPGLVPQAPGPLQGIDAAASVHASARIVAPARVAGGAVVEAGATVGPEAVVGSGARIGPGAHVERSVIWEGAVAHGQIIGRIVTGEAEFPA